MSKSFKKGRDRQLSFKDQGNLLQASLKGAQFETMLESAQPLSGSELMLKGLRENVLTVSQS